jgi:PAS domain S-box-containing protein
MEANDNEEDLLRSVALQNARAILLARERAEKSLLEAKKELEQKNAEISEQGEWFKVTLSSIGDGVITTDTHGNLTFLNPIAETMTGWKSAEAMGLPLDKVFIIINEHSRQPVENPIAKVLREGRMVSLANHAVLVAKDGSGLPIEDSAAPIRDAEGKIAGAVMVFHDVTERRRKDDALLRSEQFNRSIIRGTQDCIKVLDLKGNLLFISENGQRALSLTDLTPYLNKPWADFWRGEYREAALSAVRSATEGKSAGFVGSFVTLKGELRWWDVVVSPILGPGGQPETLLAVSRDVTERRQAEERLGRLAAVIESSDDAILSMSLDAIITTWNRGAEKMYGYTAQEAFGRSVKILIPPDRADEEPEILERLTKGERIDHYETVRRTKSGTDIHVSLTVSPIMDATGKVTGVSKIARDITQRKRDEEQLSRYAEDLEKQVAERTATLREKIGELEAFSYSVSHDLRAPLRAIQSFALILGEDCGSKLNCEEQDYLRRMSTAAERMDRLIQDVLSYSRISRLESPPVPVDLGKLLHDIVETYPMFQPPSARIELRDPFPEALGEEAVLSQCVSNILSNAVKFVAPGMTPQVWVWSDLTSGGEKVRLFFKDNGLGIPPEAHQRIFGIFERVTNDYEGTGIGLSIVKKGVERMGGSVGLESEVGNGTTFWLELNRPKLNIS